MGVWLERGWGERGAGVWGGLGLRGAFLGAVGVFFGERDFGSVFMAE